MYLSPWLHPRNPSRIGSYLFAFYTVKTFIIPLYGIFRKPSKRGKMSQRCGYIKKKVLRGVNKDLHTRTYVGTVTYLHFIQ
jgi:hypothetical protein